MSLSGKVAIVTGGVYGIGFAVAQKFVDAGATVVIADVKGYAEAAAKLSGQTNAAWGIFTDVTSDESVASLVDQVIARFGAVHILVNNAAISAGLQPAPFETLDSELWKRIYDVNVIGAFRTCRAVSPHMRAQKWGRIINIASGTALKGVPGVMHYVASKGAVIAMTRSLANEFGADNVLCNVVSPGLTLTESVRESAFARGTVIADAAAARAIKRDGQAIDVANAIYLFATEEAGFITGQTLVADGGSYFN